MKRLILTALIASAFLALPRAQDRARVFTTGTAAELAVAQTRGVQQLRVKALERGIAY